MTSREQVSAYQDKAIYFFGRARVYEARGNYWGASELRQIARAFREMAEQVERESLPPFEGDSCTFRVR